jgi:hypothetical protein
MKRVDEDGDEKIPGSKKQKAGPKDKKSKSKAPLNVQSNNDDGFMKYSQNVDIQETFKLNRIDGKITNEGGKQVLFLNFSRNVKIRRKLDQIFRFFEEKSKEETKEIIFIGTGEAIQKMITIIEIMKQKIVQLQNYEKIDGELQSKVKNNLIAKIPDDNKISITGKISKVEELKLNYNQFNFLDFTLIEKQTKIRSMNKETANKVTKDNELYDQSLIDSVLKVDKLVKLPVMYVYMNFHKDEQVPVYYVNKFKNLISNGWSIQQS